MATRLLTGLRVRVPWELTARMERLIKADDLPRYSGQPLYLFIGIDTAGSRVHHLFPQWAEALELEGHLLGVDLPENADPQSFRAVVSAMATNPAIHGAVVTSHKLRLHRAAADLIEVAEPLVKITHELNSLDVRAGVKAFARDAQSLEVLLLNTPTLLERRPEVICLGSGGSAIALMLALGLDLTATVAEGRPVGRAHGPLSFLRIEGRRAEALEEVAAVAQRAGLNPAGFSMELASGPQEWDAIVRRAAPDSLVINATGLGKLGPGSPVSDEVAFPRGALAWDFNYRGPLTFLEQARQRSVSVEDGWDYFVAGWSCALAAITGRDPVEALGRLIGTTTRSQR